MGLQNVSETYMEEALGDGPAHPPVHDFAPPLDLTGPTVYAGRGGYPHDVFQEMRENAPILWHPEEHGAGFWALTSYDLVKKAELDPASWSSQKGGILMSYGLPDMPRHPLLHRASLDTMICLDRPYHTPLRMEHMAFFRAGYVAELRRKVERFVDERLDAMEREGPVLDMVEHFSAELPLFTLCEILGVPEADRPKLVHWMHFLENSAYQMQQEGLGAAPAEQMMTFLQEIQALFDYGRSLLMKRRDDPKEDLLSAIAHAEVDGERLSDEFLDGSWLLIVFAGNDTTRNSLSGTMKLLTEHMDQRERLLADPDLFPNFVHESIRMVTPVTYMRRTAATDTELGGQRVAEGEKAVMFYAAANRDPAVFPDPHRYDIARANAKDHLAFGHGPHVCLGQRVANMQLDVAYRAILERFPKVRWTGKSTLAPNNFVHAISELEIDLRG